MYDLGWWLRHRNTGALKEPKLIPAWRAGMLRYGYRISTTVLTVYHLLSYILLLYRIDIGGHLE